jgi:hypothetical protein
MLLWSDIAVLTVTLRLHSNVQLDFAMVALGFQKAPVVGPPDTRSPRGRPASKGSQSAIDTIIDDGTVRIAPLLKFFLFVDC